MSNLPKWKHASKIYSHAYVILENMARAGHAKTATFTKKGKIRTQGIVSDEMQDFIEALNKGNEELIKWYILNNIKHLNK